MNSKKTIFFATFLGSLSCQVSHVYPRSFFGKITKPLRVVKRSIQGTKNAVLSHNFHKVDYDLYRSSQPSRKHLRKYHKRNNVKTVINLRGENPSKIWWEEERDEANRLGMTFVNIRTNSKQKFSRDNIKKLIGAYENGRKKGSVLVHCQAGSDRSGAAAGILKFNTTRNKHQALKQLSLKYGHMRKRKPSMYDTVLSWIDSMIGTNFNPEKALESYK